MFSINTETRRIRLYRGDTGKIDFRMSGYRFERGDVVMFTIRNGSGTVMREELLTPENNTVTLVFRNGDTEDWPEGFYKYDLRVVHVPVYDDEDHLVDGAFVRTPMNPANIEVYAVVGDV